MADGAHDAGQLWDQGDQCPGPRAGCLRDEIGRERSDELAQRLDERLEEQRLF